MSKKETKATPKATPKKSPKKSTKKEQSNMKFFEVEARLVGRTEQLTFIVNLDQVVAIESHPTTVSLHMSGGQIFRVNRKKGGEELDQAVRDYHKE